FFDVDVGVHGALGFEVADGGEAVVESDAGIARGEDGAVGDGVLEELLVVILGGDVAVEEHMSVNIDEAGKHGSVREVNGFDAGWGGAAGSDRDDVVAFNKDEYVVERLVGFAVEEMPGADGDALRRWGG